ncbi:MAG: 4-hydroxybenzoyl-CoA reductase subunit beta [Myxococcota bacterium]|jgi:4-hydroxybenzoyl-CoA reductase subunit beta
MLPFPTFAYEAPDRLKDALAIAAAPGSRIVAGGTDLLPSMKHRLFTPDTLLSLRRVEGLTDIAPTPDGGLSIGTMATLRTVRRNPLVSGHYPALSEACRTIATGTIQAMGTLGGNVMLDTRCLYYNQPAGWRESIGGCLKAEGQICHVAPKGRGCYAAHSADTIPALWLYGASVELASRFGVRQVTIADLYDEDGRTWVKIQPGEILTRIILPAPSAPVVHRKLRLRNAIDYGLLLVAVQRDGVGARAVISAIGPQPILVHVPAAGDLPEAAYKAAKPLSTHAIASVWRKQMVRVEVKRALAEL